jgi:hypothetical protein
MLRRRCLRAIFVAESFPQLHWHFAKRDDTLSTFWREDSRGWKFEACPERVDVANATTPARGSVDRCLLAGPQTSPTSAVHFGQSTPPMLLPTTSA